MSDECAPMTIEQRLARIDHDWEFVRAVACEIRRVLQRVEDRVRADYENREPPMSDDLIDAATKYIEEHECNCYAINGERMRCWRCTFMEAKEKAGGA